MGIAAAKVQGFNWGENCKKLDEERLASLNRDLGTLNFVRGYIYKHLQEKDSISRATLYRYRQLFKQLSP